MFLNVSTTLFRVGAIIELLPDAGPLRTVFANALRSLDNNLEYKDAMCRH